MLTQNTYGMPRERGFTLIELMIVVVVAAVLLSIAVPTWTTQIRKSRRTDAKSAVLDLASREERFFSTNNVYSQTAADLGYTALPTLIGSGYYLINVAITPAAPPVPASYLITATAQGTQANDLCVTYTLDQTGAQGGSSPTCWN